MSDENLTYQVKVTYESPNVTEVFALREQAVEFARDQLLKDEVVKVAVKKIVPREEKMTEDRSDADDNL